LIGPHGPLPKTRSHPLHSQLRQRILDYRQGHLDRVDTTRVPPTTRGREVGDVTAATQVGPKPRSERQLWSWPPRWQEDFTVFQVMAETIKDGNGVRRRNGRFAIARSLSTWTPVEGSLPSGIQMPQSDAADYAPALCGCGLPRKIVEEN